MKRLLYVIAILGGIYVAARQNEGKYVPGKSVPTEERTTAAASGEFIDGVQSTGEGIVTRILPDDNEGSRHQRFILKLSSGRTLLVAHNIDLAPRLGSLKIGDAVYFSGVYETNPQGGVIHWTHRDPKGKHPPGWLKYNNQIFQ